MVNKSTEHIYWSSFNRWTVDSIHRSKVCLKKFLCIVEIDDPDDSLSSTYRQSNGIHRSKVPDTRPNPSNDINSFQILSANVFFLIYFLSHKNHIFLFHNCQILLNSKIIPNSQNPLLPKIVLFWH